MRPSPCDVVHSDSADAAGIPFTAANPAHACRPRRYANLGLRARSEETLRAGTVIAIPLERGREQFRFLVGDIHKPPGDRSIYDGPNLIEPIDTRVSVRQSHQPMMLR